MTERDERKKGHILILVDHWIDKAQNDLGSAQANFESGRLGNAVRDIYFACFHAVSALFMKNGKTFKKHSQVRASFHREIIKTGIVDMSWGPFYEWVFDHRQQADYQPMARFEPDEVKEILDLSGKFVAEIKGIIEGR